MEVCIRYGGQQHCFTIPVVQIPIHFPKPGPGPVNYPAFLSDAVVVASLQSMTQNIADAKVRVAVEAGLAKGLDAMREHAGSEVAIR